MAEKTVSPPESSAFSQWLRYVEDKDLNALKNYRYVGVDHSLLANHIMQPFWRWAVEFLPKTMAPNLVTVIGFLFILVSYLVTTYYVPVLFGEAPRWVYFMNALFLFIYQTMDALDGKQARRTASSSPLGELVDHGCDAICMTVMTLTLGASVSIGTDPVWVTCYMLIASMAGFYAAQWEEYHTGVLELGYFNVTEGQFVVMGIYLTSGFLGSSWWLNTLSVLGFTFRYNELIVLLGSVPMFITIINSIWVMSRRVGEGKTPFFLAFGRLVPYASLTGAVVVWALNSSLRVAQNYPHRFLGAYGFFCANIIGRMVVARVCEQSFRPFQLLLVSSYVGAGLALSGAFIYSPLFEYLYLNLFYVHSILCYYFFARSVIIEMTAYLNINFLTLKKKGE